MNILGVQLHRADLPPVCAYYGTASNGSNYGQDMWINGICYEVWHVLVVEC